MTLRLARLRNSFVLTHPQFRAYIVGCFRKRNSRSRVRKERYPTTGMFHVFWKLIKKRGKELKARKGLFLYWACANVFNQTKNGTNKKLRASLIYNSLHDNISIVKTCERKNAFCFYLSTLAGNFLAGIV